jgi:hypothetical protein
MVKERNTVIQAVLYRGGESLRMYYSTNVLIHKGFVNILRLGKRVRTGIVWFIGRLRLVNMS